MKTIIYHNPRCSKSRQTLALLTDQGHDVTERRYLDDAPSEDEIRVALDLLGIEPIALMRVKEAAFREQGLRRDDAPEQLIAAMAKTPKLIERPVVFANGKAALGRPPEAVLDIL